MHIKDMEVFPSLVRVLPRLLTVIKIVGSLLALTGLLPIAKDC